MFIPESRVLTNKLRYNTFLYLKYRFEKKPSHPAVLDILDLATKAMPWKLERHALEKGFKSILTKHCYKARPCNITRCVIYFP